VTRSYAIGGDDVQRTALGYLHANCGHCHAEAATAEFMHMRILPREVDGPIEELEAYRSLVGGALSDEWKERPERFTTRVVPGDPEQSSIVYRMEQRGDDELVQDQMPPLATRKVDDEGLAAVRAWVASLPPAAEVPDAGPGDDVGRNADSASERDGGSTPGGLSDAGSAQEPDSGRATGAGRTPGRDLDSSAVDDRTPAACSGSAGCTTEPSSVAGAGVGGQAGIESSGSGGVGAGGASGSAPSDDLDAGTPEQTADLDAGSESTVSGDAGRRSRGRRRRRPDAGSERPVAGDPGSRSDGWRDRSVPADASGAGFSRSSRARGRATP